MRGLPGVAAARDGPGFSIVKWNLPASSVRDRPKAGERSAGIRDPNPGGRKTAKIAIFDPDRPVCGEEQGATSMS
jgi:hypothetical protein